MMFDYLIENATIVDGLGGKPSKGNVAIADGKIAGVGDVSGPARETINADGAYATPGWVDVHTHFDGQVSWDDKLDPSFSHGVTSVVMGNCGVGFAPCPRGGEKRMIELMEGVEDIRALRSMKESNGENGKPSPSTSITSARGSSRWTSAPRYRIAPCATT